MASSEFRRYQRSDAPFLQPGSDVFGLAESQRIERSILAVGRRLRGALLRLNHDLATGAISLSGYSNSARGIIRVAYFSAYSLGAISVFPFYTLTDRDVGILDRELSTELGFLRAFGRDIDRSRTIMDVTSRTNLYVLALRGIFERGRLEAMPSWPLRWRLGINEHCESCIRAWVNGPYQLNQFTAFGLPVLPGVPGDGSVCDGLTRCGCTVEFQSGVPVPNQELSQRLPQLLAEVVNGSSAVA